MRTYWEHAAGQTEPMLSFKGKEFSDWESWKKQALPTLLKLLGDFPGQTVLEPEIEYSAEENGIIRERFVFNSEEFMPLPCRLLRPGGKYAIEQTNYNYAEQTARKGFLTISPDIRGIGEGRGGQAFSGNKAFDFFAKYL